ncbi:MAG: aminotransferase class V-fold PLP-dependent enzyme [Planctomycetota bacterium]|nr:aminotransferase class V-fold PLP-dependent enzyme [Planctomycetota bacterium]
MTRPLPRPSASLDLDADQMELLTKGATSFVIDHLTSLGEQPSWDTDGAEQLGEELTRPLPEAGRPFEETLHDMGRAIAKSYNTASGRYMAYIPGGGLYPAALADYIALTANRYVGMHDAAPALVAIERMAIDWLREFVGYPEGAEGLLTTGGTLSTLVALVTARTVRLGEDMVGATYYTSEQAHSCIAKSARLAGLPTAGLRLISTDERLRMDPAALAKQIAADRAAGLRPFLVAATAGTTNTGAVDPVPAIADICESEGLWLHVDGAYGGFFRGVPGGHELLPGLERADSLVLDPHKSLFLPYGTGCLLVREPGQLQQAHGSAADYLQDLTATAHNFAEMSPELTREARGLRVWAAVDFYGAEALRDALREKLELAQWLHDELSTTEGIEMGDRPQLSVVSFRFRSADGDSDALNEALLHKINARRRIFLSSTKINGMFTLRVCLLHFRTNGDEVKAALEEIQAAAAI